MSLLASSSRHPFAAISARASSVMGPHDGSQVLRKGLDSGQYHSYIYVGSDNDPRQHLADSSVDAKLKDDPRSLLSHSTLDPRSLLSHSTPGSMVESGSTALFTHQSDGYFGDPLQRFSDPLRHYYSAAFERSTQRCSCDSTAPLERKSQKCKCVTHTRYFYFITVVVQLIWISVTVALSSFCFLAYSCLSKIYLG
jgi:hypothetical protein